MGPDLSKSAGHTVRMRKILGVGKPTFLESEILWVRVQRSRAEEEEKFLFTPLNRTQLNFHKKSTASLPYYLSTIGSSNSSGKGSRFKFMLFIHLMTSQSKD